MKWTRRRIENTIILAVCAAFLIFFNLKNGKDSAGGKGFRVITYLDNSRHDRRDGLCD